MERTNYPCQTCGHIFQSDQELKDHLRSAHGSDSGGKQQGGSQSKQKEESAA
jgi:uncharacterized C2H2 Zn-finger protein